MSCWNQCGKCGESFSEVCLYCYETRERALIVAWLRDQIENRGAYAPIERLVAAIERGEHVK